MSQIGRRTTLCEAGPLAGRRGTRSDGKPISDSTAWTKQGSLEAHGVLLHGRLAEGPCRPYGLLPPFSRHAESTARRAATGRAIQHVARQPRELLRTRNSAEALLLTRARPQMLSVAAPARRPGRGDALCGGGGNGDHRLQGHRPAGCGLRPHPGRIQSPRASHGRGTRALRESALSSLARSSEHRSRACTGHQEPRRPDRRARLVQLGLESPWARTGPRGLARGSQTGPRQNRGGPAQLRDEDPVRR